MAAYVKSILIQNIATVNSSTPPSEPKRELTHAETLAQKYEEPMKLWMAMSAGEITLDEEEAALQVMWKTEDAMAEKSSL
jgi:hypothetical protein